ncbi:MAG: hypothetical protein WDN03_03990 [Rhizomicrobium sp.]
MSLTLASAAQATRTPALPATGLDARDIVAATQAYLEHELGFPVTLRASVIRKNDRYAYIVARVSASSPLPAFFARDPALDAMLEKKHGHWTTMSYQSGSPKNGGGNERHVRLRRGCTREHLSRVPLALDRALIKKRLRPPSQGFPPAVLRIALLAQLA